MSGPDELSQALERLVTLGQSPDVNIRPVLLRVVVDMFVRKDRHAPADLAQFEAIALHLIEDADPEARRIVADKLSRHPATPRALLDRLIAEQGGTATLVYRHAALGADALTAAACWGVGEVAEAIAGRPGLTPATVAALAERPEAAVVLALASNDGSDLDRPTVQKLVRRSRDDAALARRLAARAADPLDIAPLFHLVDGEQRAAIIEAARRSELGKRQWGRLDGTTAAALERMDRLMRAGDRDGFETALCSALGLDGARLLPLIGDEGGEGLALALAAAGAPPDLAARIFILGDARIGRSVAKVRTLTHIVEALSAHAARRLIDAIVGGPGEGRRRAAPQATQPVPRRVDHAAGLETAVPRREAVPAPIRRRL